MHSNYINFQNDIMLPNHLASLAKLERERGTVTKNDEGHFSEKDITVYSAWKIPLLGGLYLYQYLKSLGFDARIIQHVQFEQEQLDRYLSQAPKVIGISTTLLLNPMDIADLVRYCRQKSPTSLIVLGGMSIWNNYLANKDNPDVFKSYRADVAVIDPKGLKTLGKIVGAVIKKESLLDIPNLILYTEKVTRVTKLLREEYDFIKDGIRWDLIDTNLTGKITLLRTQISCPFSCSFCSYPTSQGPVVKTELASFEAELKVLQKRGVRYLLFVDDTFNVPPHRFKEMLEILKNYDFKWYAFIRCQYLDEEQVIDMRKSGCAGAYLGIESANKDILKTMNKKATADDYMRGVKWLKSQGITTYASFIVGFPGETAESVQDTIRFIETSGVDFYNVKIFYYDHTTPIASRASEFGLTGQGMSWTHNTMTSSEAFNYSEMIIKTIKNVPYIPQHSGEIWEIAYFHERGFTKENVRKLYMNFTRMIQDELNESPQREENQKKLFKELVEFC